MYIHPGRTGQKMHCRFIPQTDLLKLCGETVGVCSEIYIKYIIIVWAEFRVFKTVEIQRTYASFARFSKTEILIVLLSF
jgi:hypothetical protein